MPPSKVMTASALMVGEALILMLLTHRAKRSQQLRITLGDRSPVSKERWFVGISPETVHIDFHLYVSGSRPVFSQVIGQLKVKN